MSNKSMCKILLVLLLICTFPLNTFAADLKAKWISTEKCQSTTNTWLMFRKDILVNEVPRSIVARIASDTKYWLWINGYLVVFEGGLKRGPAPHSTYYDEVELSHYLKKGDNSIALLVWHFGKDGFSHCNSGKAGLFFEAIADKLQIVSDATWRCSLASAFQQTEAPFPNFRLAESNIRYDARLALKNWNQSLFYGKLEPAEEIAEENEAPFGPLVKRPIPLWKDYGLKDYKSTYYKGDTLCCKLPYNCQMTPYIKLESEAGRIVHMLTDHYRGGGTESVRAEYITCSGVQEYENLGWMNGHQMFYVIPKGVKVLDVKFRETGYDTEFLGSFSCNDVFLNELWKRSMRTLYVTMRDNYMDCPDRERAQWWGDEVNELGESFYAFSASSHQLAVKGIYELVNWQKKDGAFFSPVPAGNWGKELPLQMLASIGWYGFYTQYFFSGDSSFVADVYPAMRKYLHEVIQLDNEGLVIERPGAWSWGDWGENVDMGVLFNCWYYLALKAELQFARMLNKCEDAGQIASLMNGIMSNFDSRYWTGSSYRSPNYNGKTDDRAQAMAVLSGLASEDKYEKLYQVLKEEYHASPYMEKYVLESLLKMGYIDFAIQRMKSRYAKMLSYSEYTTLFEGWGIGDEGFGGGTTNHAWSGGPLTLLSAYVAGITPTSPGFKTFQIKPQLGPLKEVNVVVPVSTGLIKLCIQRKRSKYYLNVTVPHDTSAEIVVTNKIVKQLSEGTYQLTCDCF